MIFFSYDVDSSIRNWKNLIKIDSRRSSKKCYLCLYLFARVTFLYDSFLKRLYRSLLIWMIKREKGRGSTRRILKFNCTQLKRLWGRITTSCVETLERYRYERERERELRLLWRFLFFLSPFLLWIFPFREISFHYQKGFSRPVLLTFLGNFVI